MSELEREKCGFCVFDGRKKKKEMGGGVEGL